MRRHKFRINKVQFKDRGDWITLFLIGFCHLVIALLVFGYLPFSEITIILFLTPLLTWYSSFQHEVMHGHPFKSQILNDMLVTLPWTVIFPYHRFRDTHLAHHMDVNLCDPYDDPESWYQTSSDWEKRSRLSKAVFNFNNTLVGRMLIGPLIAATGFIKCDFHHFLNGEMHIGVKWVFHFMLVALLLSAVAAFGAISLTGYLIAAYLGASLLMVRTFLEHQAHEKVAARTVIIENGGMFALLFLNNSYHAVHHAHPNRAWYRLPKLYREKRDHFLKMNQGYTYSNYLEIFRLFSFKRKESVPLIVDLNSRAKTQNSK